MVFKVVTLYIIYLTTFMAVQEVQQISCQLSNFFRAESLIDKMQTAIIRTGEWAFPKLFMLIGSREFCSVRFGPSEYAQTGDIVRISCASSVTFDQSKCI